MAISGGDGSIILTTKVDTSGVKKGTDSISSMAKKAGVALAAAFSVKKIYDFVRASVDAFADYEQLVGGVETLFGKSSKKLMEYANQAYKTTGQSANEYMQNVTAFSASLLSAVGGDTEKAADVANAAMISISDNVNKMGSSAESVQLAFQGFAKQQYMLLDNLKLGYGGTKGEMERLLKDAQAITGVEYNIDNLADVYTAIGVIQEKLGIAGTTAKEASTTISGSAATMKAAWQNVLVAVSSGKGLDTAIENFANSFSTYFDNILPVVERSMIGIGAMIEDLAPKLAESVGRAFIASIPSLITAVYAMIVGFARGIFNGVIALFRGKTKEVLEEQAEQTEKAAENIKEQTKNQKELNKEVKKSLSGFDDIQILSSKTAENLEDTETMDFGAGGGTVTGSFIGGEVVKEISDELSSGMMIVGIVAIVLGILLCMAQQWAWGIGLIAVGAAGIVTPIALNWDGIKEQLQGSFGGWLVLGGVIAIILGILLCFTPALPLGIGLIVLGAAAVVAPVVANWDAISNKITEIFTEFAGIIAIAGTALIVLGIILCCTGVGIGLGIGLILAGVAGLATVVAVNWDAIVDWVKGAWDAVKAFWDKYIAPIFTAKFWLDLAKKCGNGLISGFEAAINGIISLFETMINWIVDGLNSISIDVPDWVPVIGGSKFGFNIPRANFGRVKIPRLAQGAVIPPNREFLAVLGDQKQGTNIEAPLQTIVDAFNIALAQNGGARNGNTEIILEIDGREFGRAVVEQGNRENRRIGTRLAVV